VPLAITAIIVALAIAITITAAVIIAIASLPPSSLQLPRCHHHCRNHLGHCHHLDHLAATIIRSPWGSSIVAVALKSSSEKRVTDIRHSIANKGFL
jgi:hypothetical protein